MTISNLHIYDAAQGVWRPTTADDLRSPALTPIGSLVTIAVTGDSTLAALMTAASASIASNCTWLELQIRDDQTAGNVVKLNYTGTVSSTLYDAIMTRDTSRAEGSDLILHGTKAIFDAYHLLASATTQVLVRQYA